VKTLAAIGALLALAFSAEAHRLDEYLQATRVGVTLDRVELSLDLTPGVAIVPELLPTMDPDGNRRLSGKEQKAYAQRVLRDLRLELDGKQMSLKLSRLSFPPYVDLGGGEGVIHLLAVAKIPRLTPAQHEVVFRNNHLPNISVYLVNALLPGSRGITITRQMRDELQKVYCLEFQVKRA
jgi:hypothetical protein